MKLKKLLIAVIVATLAGSVVLPMNASEVNGKATISYTPGQIVLQEVPYIDFGTQKIVGRTNDYPAQVFKDSLKVLDARGSLSGWGVTLQLSEFKQENAPALKGTSLIIDTPKPVPQNTVGIAPENSYQEFYAGDTNSKYLLRASPGEGSGTWVLPLSPRDVKLRIPGSSAKPGNYNAQLEWTLIDAP